MSEPVYFQTNEYTRYEIVKDVDGDIDVSVQSLYDREKGEWRTYQDEGIFVPRGLLEEFIAALQKVAK